ncbi:MAG: methylated-DNA-[protein]-cysteine S-methyltransferase [Candidatus Eremiobacteraeota bacterium]|jgi:methylated-DNA-[protein]-cysteine S-methyltransferase|nr:methylated-DNA-[protein]-cysteine S-methyltransferase [Candidatus Eremiobacteraeota bacterium]
MHARGFALFPTPIGACGIAWSERGIAGAQLPESDERGTRNRMQRRFPNSAEASPPEIVTVAIDRITALLNGEHDDLASIVLDISGVPEFNQRVYEAARRIPPGTIVTYGDVAKRVGEPGAAQAVGQALGRNPFAPIVPCHRIVSAAGKMHGFSAGGGTATKLRMLTIEGWRSDEPTLFELGSSITVT